MYNLVINDLKCCLRDGDKTCKDCSLTSERSCMGYLHRRSLVNLIALKDKNRELEEKNLMQKSLIEHQELELRILRSGWISIKKELPQSDGEVLVMIKGAKKATTLEFDTDTKNFWSEYSDSYEVTHWMPLPKPPKGKCKNE